MSLRNGINKNGYSKQPFVWVLAPHLETHDPNIDYYYDFTQSIAEYTKAFNELKIDWKWQPVTLRSYQAIIEQIAGEAIHKKIVVLNLCDGDEINGTPGISVLRLLEEKDLVYTGASEYFYDITTSKIPMKEVFDKHKIATPGWKAIRSKRTKLEGVIEKLGAPLILKPAVSGGSMGVSVTNVVNTKEELQEQVSKMFNGYHKWELTSDGALVEQYVNGPEYTIMIVGSCDTPERATIYPPVERVFHSSLPDNEKFLSFGRLWEIYDDEKPLGDDQSFYEYSSVSDKALEAELCQLSWEAYKAVKGTGYGRIDIRMDKATGKLYVLEVNAQCGISEDENYTSIGAILRFSQRSFAQMVKEIMKDALVRHKARQAVQVEK
jgi:D-alanine-D-alanine ligase